MQRQRRAFQIGFFALFLCAPALNLLRFDVTEVQLWVLGQRWSLGLDAFRQGLITPTEMALQLVLRAFVPAIALVGLFLAVAWRYGRLYCGWLCPHFSLVELLNHVLQKACGRLSLWNRKPTPKNGLTPDRRWWPVFVLLCLVMGFVWAITLLTYLLPPADVWGRLLRGESTLGQAQFLAVFTAVFTAEFLFARHLFCRFGCAVGLFQSLVWMANPRGRVVGFARDGKRPVPTTASGLQAAHPSHCRSCDAPHGNACDRACPMHLPPRNFKRRKFSCVQCGLCVQACDTSQSAQQREPLLQWRIGVDALRESLHAPQPDPAAPSRRPAAIASAMPTPQES
ncbi:4Fe-4S binding protein [Acidovorax sp.]|uniref:4Fe-4S binding protein n=1 Tax=Acidovorax sp. TaxID=1872122 RepID=UPI002613E857|nr:4Fe-4S binding protein [Acidovorax sp.]